MTVELLAPAKVNLTLHITGQRADGYHLLDSLVVFADFGDRLRLEPGHEMQISLRGPFAKGVPTDGSNLIWKAAAGAGWSGHVLLDKQLPHGAGIGGGSSDAAAMLKAIGELGQPIPADLPLALGADVPVCQEQCATRMRGIGEELTPIELPRLHALLVNPGVCVPTAAVFQGLAARENPSMPTEIPEFSAAEDCAHWLQTQRNDLETPAIAVAPIIDRALADLRATRNVLLARMSGSGATCLALYPSKQAAHMAAYEIGAEHPEWWCRATCLT